LKRLGYDDVNEFKKLTPSDAEKMEGHLITGGVPPGHAGKILRAARATPAPVPVETPMLVLRAASSWLGCCRADICWLGECACAYGSAD